MKKNELSSIKGIGPSAIEKLNKIGVYSVEDLSTYSLDKLSDVKGFGSVKAKNVIEGAKEKIQLKINVPILHEDNNENSTDSEDEEDLNDLSIPKLPKVTVPGKLEIKNEQEINYNKEKHLDDFIKIDKNFSEKESIIIDEFDVDDDDLKEVVDEFLEEQEEISETQETFEDDGFSNEKITLEERRNLEKQIRENLAELEFYVISKKDNLVSEIYEKIDMLAIKNINIHRLVDLILIIPIKICDVNGSLIVSEKNVDYKSSTLKLKINNTIKDYLIGPNLEDLSETRKKIFIELTNEGNLFQYFTKYLSSDITVEKSFTNERLFFRSEQYEIKIIIDPILVCKNDALSSERTIPFPYQKTENLHVINTKLLSSLLQFLENKYPLIENYSDKETSIDKYYNARIKFNNNIEKCSIPVLIYFVIFASFLILNFSSILSLLLNVSFAVVPIYCIALMFLYYMFYKEKSIIKKEFNLPYFRREIKIDDHNLILINEELGSKSKKLLEQFGYECFGKQKSSILDNLMEIDNNSIYNSSNESLLHNKGYYGKRSKIETVKKSFNNNLNNGSDEDNYLKYLDD